MQGWSYLVAGSQVSRCRAGATWLLGLNYQDVGLELPGCWVSTIKMQGWSYLVAGSQLSRCRAGATWLLGLNYQDAGWSYWLLGLNYQDVGLELPGCWVSTIKMQGWSYLVAGSQLSRCRTGATLLLGLNYQDAGLELPGCWVSTIKM